MTELIQGNETHIAIIAAIAEETWAQTYKDILSPGQLRFMLDVIYSPTELLKSMQNGSQKFILVSNCNSIQGFASFGARQSSATTFKLHKLYVLPGNHGKGFGRLLIEAVKKEVLRRGGDTLELNVNRFNPAQEFYKKLGFNIIREEDIPIGEYWMNDYVMRLVLKQ